MPDPKTMTEQEAFTYREREAAMIYDTFVISKNLADLSLNADKEKYADLFVLDKIPFFTNQNHTRSIVGEAYAGQDVATLLQTGFDVFSLGIAFLPPCTATPDEVANPEEAISSHIFACELPKHCGAIFRVRENEKLVVPCLAAPSGMGFGGGGLITDNPDLTTFTGNVVGEPALRNRFIFPEPVLLKKDDYCSLTITLTPYARALTAQMPGPGEYAFKGADGKPYSVPIPKRAMILVSLMGRRAKRML